VVGKASTNGIGISDTPPIIFTGGQKVQNLASFKTSLKFEPPAFENAAIYPNSETKVQCSDDRPMSWPSLVKSGPRIHEKLLSVLTPPPEIARENALNRGQLSRVLFDFAHILYRV